MKLIAMLPILISGLVLSFNSAHAETVEVVIFNAKPNVPRQQMINAANSMLGTLKGWQGFISRELIELDQGRWIDIVHWENMQAAKVAQQKAMQSESCLLFFALIDEKQERIFHGTRALLQHK